MRFRITTRRMDRQSGCHELLERTTRIPRILWKREEFNRILKRIRYFRSIITCNDKKLDLEINLPVSATIYYHEVGTNKHRKRLLHFRQECKKLHKGGRGVKLTVSEWSKAANLDRWPPQKLDRTQRNDGRIRVLLKLMSNPRRTQPGGRKQTNSRIFFFKKRKKKKN